MATYPILQFPDPLLGRPGKQVTVFDENLKTVVNNMFETHYSQENCAALAATQLGLEMRITVIDFSDEKNQPLCLINPEIIEKSGSHQEEEGCMSVAGVSAKVTRASKIKVKYQDVNGEEHQMSADGFMAKCIQHEVDHLNGILYLERLNHLKRKMLEMKILKLKNKKKS
jgi:peptide deformylase